MIFLKQIFFLQRKIEKKNRKKLMSKNQFYKVYLHKFFFDPPLVVILPNYCHVQVIFLEMSFFLIFFGHFIFCYFGNVLGFLGIVWDFSGLVLVGFGTFCPPGPSPDKNTFF